MITNALGIATRELESRDADIASESHSFAVLYENAAQTGSLQQLNQTLARDIRAGKFEQGAEQEVRLRQHLFATARAKLAVTYPKGLSENNIK